jgi:lipoprotein-anchoring transpeptidase ErfK/SrfK
LGGIFLKRVFLSVLIAALALSLFVFFISSKRGNNELDRQLEQARLLRQNGDMKAAEDLYKELISSNQDNPEVIKAMDDLAQLYETKGLVLKAKNLYQEAILSYPEAEEAAAIQEKLWNLNIKILFSGLADDKSQIYEVQPKDTLISIAKKFNTTVPLIKESNDLDNEIIRPQDRLKVVNANFSIIVDKSQNTLTLKSGDDVVKIYDVSTGKDNCTPVGEFTIENKLVNPVHYKKGEIVPAESPDNVLGSRWMGLSAPSYGIHGTIDEETIGSQITEGCVRMRNKDVEELFVIVPVGTKVTIVN